MNIKHILISFLLLLVACGTDKKNQNTEQDTTEDKKTLQKESEKSSHNNTKIKTEKRAFKGSDYSISYEVITEGNEALIRKAHATLLKSLTNEDNYKSIDDFEKVLKNKQYKVSSEECQNASREFNATFNQVGEVVDLSISEYTFECGAHGLGAITTYHFDVSSGKEITLKDMLKDEKGFTNEVEKQFCADHKLQKSNEAYAQAGFDSFAGGFFSANNYSFTKDGIRFSYNSYEAGPYTLPPFDVSVTYNKIKPHLVENNPLGIE